MAELIDHAGVAWGFNGEPSRPTKDSGTYAEADDLTMDRRRDDNPLVQPREQFELANPRKSDERAGIRDRQLGGGCLFGAAAWSCWRNSSSVRSMYGTSWA